MASDRSTELGRGERVWIHSPSASDEVELRRLRNESWDFLARWEPAPPDGREPASAQWFADYLESAARDDTARFLIRRVDDDALVGGVNVSAIVRGVFQSGFLGYWIGSRFARQGLMTAGLSLVVEHAFGPLALHRVEANIRPENAASIALVRRLGFRREGFSPRYLRIAGDWRDHERWALLAEDPRP